MVHANHAVRWYAGFPQLFVRVQEVMIGNGIVNNRMRYFILQWRGQKNKFRCHVKEDLLVLF